MFPTRNVSAHTPTVTADGSSPPTFFLVGNRIKSQLPHPRLISITELEELIDALQAGATPKRVRRLLIGQGASARRLTRLRRRIQTGGLADWLQIVEDGPAMASADHTHKRHPQNIIISDPQHHSDRSYVALLRIDDRCAEMSDHLSGKHVQGMVLIEASRQMVLAVGEKFLISPAHRGQRAFVTHRIDTQFHDFVLPLEVQMRLQLDSLRRGGASNFKADATITFHQAGKLAASVQFTFSVLDEQFLKVRENALVQVQLSVEGEAHQ